jgi:4-alpha-glucanotransferase
LGDFPIVAENLGIITVEVEALRKSLGFPGMAVLQFAFGVDRTAPGLLPHSYTPDTVAYTGTHDNDTIMGWWNSTGRGTTTPIDVLQAERRLARKYLGTTGLAPIGTPSAPFWPPSPIPPLFPCRTSSDSAPRPG